jgi:hypothetical protein
MCEKCVHLDSRIADLQRLSSSIDDQRMRDAIKDQIADMQARKAELHPERQSP